MVAGCQDLPMCTEKVPIPARTVKYESVTIPGLKLPYPNCGEIFKVLLCTSCEYKKPIKKTCDRPECSECWKSWASKEAERCQERFTGYKQAYKVRRNNRLGNVKNYILSPPQEMAVEMVAGAGGIDKLKKKAIALAKKYNLYGGLLLYHDIRVKKKYIPRLRALEREQKRKFWDLIREDELGLGSWEEYVYAAPHFHLKIFGSKVNGAKFHKETGWILKFKRHISRNDELRKVIFYELSHVAIRDGKRSVTWFGTMSYNKLSKTQKSVDYEVKKCPKCGAEMKIEDVITGHCEEAVAKIITYRYWINDPPRLKIQTPMEVWGR